MKQSNNVRQLVWLENRLANIEFEANKLKEERYQLIKKAKPAEIIQAMRLTHAK